MSRRDIHIRLREIEIAHKDGDGRGSAFSWEYLAGYYDAWGTVTDSLKEGRYLETRIFIWSRYFDFLQQVLEFLHRESISASIEDASKGNYERWRINITKRDSVIKFISSILYYCTIKEKRQALLDAVETMKKYVERKKKRGRHKEDGR